MLFHKTHESPPNYETVDAWLDDGCRIPTKLYKVLGTWYTESGYPLRSDEKVLKWCYPL